MWDLHEVASLAKDYKILFLGDFNNYLQMARWSRFAQVDGAITAAKLIRDCSLFVGTQTLQAWLAESLGVDRIFSTSTKFHDTTLRVEKGFKAAIQTPEQLKEAL